MANPAEQYQVEISEIFDHFLDLMRTSSAHVDIESQRFQGYCQVKFHSVEMWIMCSSFIQHFFHCA